MLYCYCKVIREEVGESHRNGWTVRRTATIFTFYFIMKAFLIDDDFTYLGPSHSFFIQHSASFNFYLFPFFVVTGGVKNPGGWELARYRVFYGGWGFSSHLLGENLDFSHPSFLLSFFLFPPSLSFLSILLLISFFFIFFLRRTGGRLKVWSLSHPPSFYFLNSYILNPASIHR